MITFFLPRLALAGTMTITACTATTTSPHWQPHPLILAEAPGTDGKPAIWIRDGFLPRTSEPDKPAVDLGTLPPHSGAVTGTCFTNRATPEHSPQSAATPLTDELITIRSRADGIFVTRTDSIGVFMETFVPGEYEISCRGSRGTVTVREGKTSLLRLTVDEISADIKKAPP
jgi:hypothetical protein